MMQSRTLRFILCVIFALHVGASSPPDVHSPESGSLVEQIQCSAVQREFVAGKIGPSSLVPNHPIHDGDMDICYRGSRDTSKKTCCSRKMERKYLQSAEKDFYDVIRSTSSYLKNLLWTNAAQYQEQFLEMIQTAENHTSELFEEVYKIPLKDRRGPLEALFMDLQAYIKRQEVNIHGSVGQFFDDLFPLVFHNILNDPSVTDLSEEYRQCLTEVRQQLYPRPFGDVPHRLQHELSRSMIAAKTFLEALSLGIETINTTDHVILESSCLRSITRLRYCSHCDGYIEARPCRNFCYNVLRGCLSTVGEIDRHWNEFVNAVKALTSNMRGPYDIEDVLRQLHSRISEAILHAMESGHKYYSQVVDKCGHPKTQDAESSPGIVGRSDAVGKPPKKHAHTSTNLNTRITTFMRSLVASKGFYRSLPDTMCSAEKFATGLDQEHCWNGETLGKYNKTLVEMDIEVQMTSNPEVKVAERQSASINGLIDKLIHIKKLLNSKVSSEMMLADGAESWKRNKHRKSSRGRKWDRTDSYKGYHGSGDGAMDDEDYRDFSGSDDEVHYGSGHHSYYGSGDYPRRNKGPKPPKRGHGQRSNPYENDLYIEDDKPSKSPPAYNNNPNSDRVTGTAAPSIHRPISVLVATLFGLFLWLNG